MSPRDARSSRCSRRRATASVPCASRDSLPKNWQASSSDTRLHRGLVFVRTDGLELFAARNRLFEPRGIEKCVPHGLPGRGDLVRAFELHAATLLLAGLTDAASNRTTGMRVAAYRDGRNHTPQGGS